jgi:hypothetical protein
MFRWFIDFYHRLVGHGFTCDNVSQVMHAADQAAVGIVIGAGRNRIAFFGESAPNRWPADSAEVTPRPVVAARQKSL